MPTRIVTYRPKKQAPQPKAQPAAITGSDIVTTTGKRGRRPPTELEDDAEADARVRASFARMMRPPSAS